VSLIRLAVLADNRLFCEGLRRILASDASLLIVTELDSPAAFKATRDASLDILLADTRMDGVFALCAELGRQSVRPWMIMLSVDGDDEWAAAALEAGARGLLPKGADGDSLVKAIHVVHDGQVWVSKRVVARIVETLAARAAVSRRVDERLRLRLSPREHEVVRHVATGSSNGEIADRLAISESTVKAHLTSIFQKLAVRDRAQLSALYHRARPLDGPPPSA